MYLLLYLLVARQFGWALVALTAGLCYHLACSHANFGWAAHYFPIPSAVLPFAAGALVSFLRRRELWSVAPNVGLAALAGWCANMAIGGWVFPDAYVFGFGYYAGVALFAVAVAGLAGLRLAAPLARLDRMLGEWAYFVFLVQWLVGFVVAVTFMPGQWRGWTLLIVSTPAITLASAGLALLNRCIVEPVRDLVRAHGDDDARTAVQRHDPVIAPGRTTAHAIEL